MAKGYTKINNDVLQGLAKLKISGATFNVLHAIINNTLSFHRNQHQLSNGYLAKATGLNESTVIRSIQELERLKIIKIVSESCGSRPRTIRILTGNIATLAKTEGGTGNSASENTGNPASENTGSSATQEIKEEIKDINKREKKKISFSSLEEMSRYYAEHPEEGGDDGDI